MTPPRRTRGKRVTPKEAEERRASSAFCPCTLDVVGQPAQARRRRSRRSAARMKRLSVGHRTPRASGRRTAWRGHEESCTGAAVVGSTRLAAQRTRRAGILPALIPALAMIGQVAATRRGPLRGRGDATRAFCHVRELAAARAGLRLFRTPSPTFHALRSAPRRPGCACPAAGLPKQSLQARVSTQAQAAPSGTRLPGPAHASHVMDHIPEHELHALYQWVRGQPTCAPATLV